MRHRLYVSPYICSASRLSSRHREPRSEHSNTPNSALHPTDHSNPKMHFSTIAAPLLLAAIVSATSAVRRQEQNPCDLATDYPTLSCCNSEASEFLASDCQVGSYSHPYLRSLARSVTQGYKNNRGSLLTAALAQANPSVADFPMYCSQAEGVTQCCTEPDVSLLIVPSCHACCLTERALVC